MRNWSRFSANSDFQLPLSTALLHYCIPPSTVPRFTNVHGSTIASHVLTGMLQRKRPGSEGSLSQQQQPPAKKTRPNQTRPAAANPAHNYSHLVTPTTAVTLTPATKHKSRSQHTPSLPRSSSPSPSLDLLPTTTSHSAALFSSAEGRDAQHQAVGAPPAAFPRAANVSPALSQLQFLLSSAHLTALTAPATARHLLRLMRHLAAEADIPSAQTVDERYCDACSTLLVPGISCKLKTRRDKQREEKWHEKQRQQRGRKQTKAAARQSGQQQDEQRVQEEAHGPTTAEGGSTQPSTRKQRHQAKRREEAVRRQKQSATDATAAGVTFVHAVNVCGRCGHQNVLPGTQRKRGGAQSKDVRKREGTDGKQPSAQRNIAAASAPSTSSEPPRKADKAREERQAKRKAQRRTQELKKQQSMSGGKPAIVTKAAGKAATAATTGPDPFVGSLFLKFQKQVSHCTHRISRRQSTLALLSYPVFSICAVLSSNRASMDWRLRLLLPLLALSHSLIPLHPLLLHPLLNPSSTHEQLPLQPPLSPYLTK